MSAQCNILKVVTHSETVQASSSVATRQTFETLGEMQNSLTLIKGELIYLWECFCVV